MESTLDTFLDIITQMGSDVIYHREGVGTNCPCRSAEGFRDPTWHHENPDAPVCNEQGFLAAPVTEFQVKASIQPALPQRGLNRAAQRVNDLLGSVEQDDHVGIFPCVWAGQSLNFRDWSEAGEDFILHDGRRFIVVAADKLPDIDGNPNHHWECGLRLMGGERP